MQAQAESMVPESPLPLPQGFTDAEEYVDSLLSFSTSSRILHTLCGGVHILDFLTRSPELYSTVFPPDWRQWFKDVDIHDVLDLLMREEIRQFAEDTKSDRTWRGYPVPPQSLISFIASVRKHLLNREFEPVTSRHGDARPSKQIFAGMSPKKIHEVDNFARYMDNLASEIGNNGGHSITHLADFGAGQNYLGRVLASNPYKRDIIAIESRAHVVEGARSLDVHTKISKKPLTMRNKKLFRENQMAREQGSTGTLQNEQALRHENSSEATGKSDFRSGEVLVNVVKNNVQAEKDPQVVSHLGNLGKKEIETKNDGRGTVQYIEHRIIDGNLSSVVEHISPSSRVSRQDSVENPTSNDERRSPPLEGMNQTSNITPATTGLPKDPALMVISLHSCGNLVHHGLRTLVLNPAVKAVALVGCCYNRMTERLGPPTHKMRLREQHPRLDATAGAYDPHGFPMSERFTNHKHRAIPQPDFSVTDMSGRRERSELETQEMPGNGADDMEEGIRLNITARMMAVQAPQNWTEEESSSFFKRHFYRALLQRIFLDKGVVGPPPSQDDDMGCSPAGSSWGLANGDGSGTAPIVIGNLRKIYYESFNSYVRGAVSKLCAGGGEVARVVQEKVGFMDDDEIRMYETHYQERKKELSILWSMMAFSAGVVEAMVVVDRWLWLKEQPCVRHAWVQPVFSYSLSPRNLVIVGIK